MGKDYKKYVDEISPKPKYLKNYTLAFIVGGIICVIGQIINDLYSKVGNLDKIPASTATSITLIFIGAFLTGLGVYDLIGKRAGAGSIIPITGFANSIVSPAMEYKREGFVLGVGANLFKIAGPVLVYGIGSSIICGFIYYIFTLIKSNYSLLMWIFSVHCLYNNRRNILAFLQRSMYEPTTTAAGEKTSFSTGTGKDLRCIPATTK